ncbi:hypothetical protein SBRY_40234 [Actinacidiphila bryophytorum]|uniref:Uncharacterized protein n=1 Tax=Actinacidiphila bryophytorum TaxID=1436133 RepID=A0A9W4MGK5_9ACTN|nr:hypothetical protein SBRY_40234 [Actinacidiphila bryophytorum]
MHRPGPARPGPLQGRHPPAHDRPGVRPADPRGARPPGRRPEPGPADPRLGVLRPRLHRRRHPAPGCAPPAELAGQLSTRHGQCCDRIGSPVGGQGQRARSQEKRDGVSEATCVHGIVELSHVPVRVHRAEAAPRCGGVRPGAQAHDIVGRRRVAHDQSPSFHRDVVDAAGGEQSGMPVGQRAVAQGHVRPEAQHPAGELLVVDVEYLSVVVRVCQGNPAARADHPQQLVQHPGRFDDVLQDPVRPGAVEHTRCERQPVPVRDSGLWQSSVPYLRDHRRGAVDRDDPGPTARAQGHGGIPGARSDLKEQPVGLGTQEVLQPLLVSGVERLRAQPVQDLNPLSGPGLRVHRRETVSNTVIVHGSTLDGPTKPVNSCGHSTGSPGGPRAGSRANCWCRRARWRCTGRSRSRPSEPAASCRVSPQPLGRPRCPLVQTY